MGSFLSAAGNKHKWDIHIKRKLFSNDHIAFQCCRGYEIKNWISNWDEKKRNVYRILLENEITRKIYKEIGNVRTVCNRAAL
jgi:hypothetical protein